MISDTMAIAFCNGSFTASTGITYHDLYDIALLIDEYAYHFEKCGVLMVKKWKDCTGFLHRDFDKPAVMYSDGGMEWLQHGETHRDNDKPAVRWADGSCWWYQYNKLHRGNDQPAACWANGYRIWYFQDKFHREHGPAVIDPAQRKKQWYRHGIFICSTEEPK